MARKAETPPDVRQTLLRGLQAGDTGALSGRSVQGVVYTAYLMGGTILACTTPEDDARLLRLFAANGLVEVHELPALIDSADGTPVTSRLVGRIDDEALTQALFERFRENLYQFLGVRGALDWEPLDAVFVDNIQVGHDSDVLLDELAALRSQLGPLERDIGRLLAPGPATGLSEEEERFCELCAPQVTLGELLDRSPFEPSRTLEIVYRLLQAGGLAEPGPPPRLRRSRAVPDPTEAAPSEPSAPRAGRPAGDEHEDIEEHTEEVQRTPTPPVNGGQEGYDAAPDDLSLDAFGDWENQREDGQFINGIRETVELAELAFGRPPEPTGEAEKERQVTPVLEMEEADPRALAQGAVSLNFEGRKLHDDDARHKLEVVNEVLATVVTCVDETQGVGVGIARMQVLIEGTSGQLAVLFSNIEIGTGGRLPVERVLRNLKKRPTGEQRHLLNRALSDVIERSLLLANEVLDQRGMERMLERIAGYQHRLGL